MIIVKLLGGLGNQMFQYAAAKALADKNQTELKIDISGFEDDLLRSFDLVKFGIAPSIASQYEIEELKAANSIKRLRERIKAYPHKKFYKEPFFHYDSNFFNLGNNVYIQGYFQSEKYFFPVKDNIRKEFSVKPFLSKTANDFAEELNNHESVSVHIRKGDYKNPDALSVHGVLPSAYYQKAINSLQGKFPAARFYLFSDDAQNARKELMLDSLTIVSGSITQNHFEDLYAMSQCRHNIIANSSFSWWGAWLNTNPDKIVIGPNNWFNKGPKDTYDVLPESWIKI